MRRPMMFAAAAVLAAAGLAACEEGAARRGDGVSSAGGGLCKPFADQTAQAAAPGVPGAMGMNGALVVEDCVHRWAYTLAGAEEDTADVVADAVVAACAAPLARWNQQSLGLAAGPDGERSALQEAPSLLTGEPTNPILEHNHFAQSRALFYVVQARAGDCDPPRVDDDRRDRDEDRAQAPAYSPNSPDR